MDAETPTILAVFTRVKIEEKLNSYKAVKLVGATVTLTAGSIDRRHDPEYSQLRQFESYDIARQYFDNKCDKFRETYHEMDIQYENWREIILNQPNTELHESVLAFLERILDNYMPMGIPSTEELADAKNALLEIGTTKNRALPWIISKSNKFYEMIPHVGRGHLDDIHKNCRPPLQTNGLVLAKKEIIDRLQLILNALNRGIEANNVNSLDHIYNNYLEVKLTSFATGSIKYESIIRDFGITPYLQADIQRVFKVEKADWNDQFLSEIGNHHYLFHSTHLANMTDILREGLRIAPHHIYSYNRWHGKGVYFFGNAEAIYYYANRLKHKVILVCRVALGNQRVVNNFMYNQVPNFVYPLECFEDSLTVLGKNQRSLFKYSEAYEAQLPSRLHNVGNAGQRYENYDEFLIQKEGQVKIEYILELKKDMTMEEVFNDIF